MAARARARRARVAIRRFGFCLRCRGCFGGGAFGRRRRYRGRLVGIDKRIVNGRRRGIPSIIGRASAAREHRLPAADRKQEKSHRNNASLRHVRLPLGCIVADGHEEDVPLAPGPTPVAEQSEFAVNIDAVRSHGLREFGKL